MPGFELPTSCSADALPTRPRRPAFNICFYIQHYLPFANVPQGLLGIAALLVRNSLKELFFKTKCVNYLVYVKGDYCAGEPCNGPGYLCVLDKLLGRLQG